MHVLPPWFYFFTLTVIYNHSFVCSHRMVGDVLLATAFLSYSGPFNQEYRALLNRNWMKELKNRKIPFTANLNLIEMLTDPTTVTTLSITETFYRLT